MSQTLRYLLVAITIAAGLYIMFLAGDDSKITRFIQHWGDKRLQPHPFKRGLMVAITTWLLTTCVIRPDLITSRSEWAETVGDAAATLLLLFAAAIWTDGVVIWREWKRRVDRD